MLNFCTLFDSSYLIKGLCMYNSLKKVCLDFHLYIFAFDDLSQKILEESGFENITVISLAEFENKELLTAKQNRSKGEYCWTCTPSTIWYCINHFDLSDCTYIDADVFFYKDPKVLIQELKGNDVLITEHRYTPRYDNTSLAGKYCVQFITFRNTTNGLNVLKWWKDVCINWCFARYEDGKFGDQKYLDDWTTRFRGIHVLNHLGGGVAPWNMQQYSFRKEDMGIIGTELSSKDEFDLIFFHFHFVHTYNIRLGYLNYLGIYKIPPSVMKLIYNPYLSLLHDLLSKFEVKNISIDFLTNKNRTLPEIIKAIAKFVLKNDSNYTINF